jgi:Tannase and feruloyl esterase
MKSQYQLRNRFTGSLLLAAGLVLSFALTASSLATVEPACTLAALSGLRVPEMTVASANAVPGSAAYPAYCDVRGSVTTDGEGAGPGAARFEIKLPAKWNGKFLFWGVGGLAGSLNPSANRTDVASSLIKGYATAITDTGHQSTGFTPTWALIARGRRNDAAVADYFYRAGHQVTVAAKQLVKSYYGSAITRAYFDGCSYGGHMGLMEAERYPGDYDAIIAGAPYLTNRTQLWGYKNAKAFLHAYIPPATLIQVDAAIRAACDAADGVKDGLIQNPAACSFDPDALVPATLTQKQADALKVYLGPVTDTNGHLVFPGSSVSNLGPIRITGGLIPAAESAPPGDVSAAEPWGKGAPLVWNLVRAFINYFVELDAGFNLNRDWPETDGQITLAGLHLFDQQTALGNVDDAKALRPFLKKGGKVLIYHGYSDPLISPFRTTQFYEDLAGAKDYDAPQKQVRLFMVPGMSHCGGGPGPNVFDTLTALDDWVEKGTAPASLLATHFTDNNPHSPPERTMPLCPFPAAARYQGSGDVNNAANWSCTANQDLLKVGADGIEAGVGRKSQGR